MYFPEEDPRVYEADRSKRVKIKSGYWFPHWCKIVAWILAVGIIITCAVVLILYGFTFGRLKFFLWLTAVFLSFILGLILFQPLKIIFMACCKACCFQTKPKLEYKVIPTTTLTNPADDKKFLRTKHSRMENSLVYVPLPKFRFEHRAEDVKFHLEQRRLFSDFAIFFLFSAALCFLLLTHKSWDDYNMTTVVKNLVVNAEYTNTIKFDEVTTYNEFVEYLNRTLLPSLLPNGERNPYVRPPGRSAGPSSGRSNRNSRARREAKEKLRRKRRDSQAQETIPLAAWDKWSREDIKERFERASDEDNYANVTKVYARSWTMEPALKMIGKPRLRQLRVRENTCPIPPRIVTREQNCFAELTWYNKEKRDFNLFWSYDADFPLTPNQARPWLYQTAWESSSVRLNGKFASYPGGGYVLDLAKNIDDSRIILNYMDAFTWIDARTRVVVIEFILYSVNVNLFSVVHLLAERSASGYFIPSYQIDTGKLIFVESELATMLVFLMIIIILLLVALLFREAIRIHKTSFLTYMTTGYAVTDIVIIILGAICIAFFFLRSAYVVSLVEQVETSYNYEYQSFDYAALWHNVSVYLFALLIMLVFLKFFMLLRFRVMFLEIAETLRASFYYFLNLALLLLIIVIAFALLFHLMLGPFEYRFSSFDVAISTLIGRAFYLDDDYDRGMLNHGPWFVAPLLFLIFVLTIALLIISFFVAVLCFFLTRIKRARMEDKYNALAYLKHILTATDRSDILHLKEKRGIYREAGAAEPMRLRGGGPKCTKCCMGDRVRYRLPPKYLAEPEWYKRRYPTFTEKKPYDFSRSYRIYDLNTFEAMRHITRSALGNQLFCGTEKEAAMKALVAYRLDPRSGCMYERFYAVHDGKRRVLISANRLVDMKELVDCFSAKKMVRIHKSKGIDIIICDEYDLFDETFQRLKRKVRELEYVVTKCLDIIRAEMEEQRAAIATAESAEPQEERAAQESDSVIQLEPDHRGSEIAVRIREIVEDDEYLECKRREKAAKKESKRLKMEEKKQRREEKMRYKEEERRYKEEQRQYMEEQRPVKEKKKKKKKKEEEDEPEECRG